MRGFTILLCAASLFWAATPICAQSSSDSDAIRKLVAAYLDARDQQDPAAVEALFTADADQLVSSGEWRKGRAAVVQGTLASSRNAAGKRSITLESIRFPAPGIAIADGRYEITGLTGGADRKMWTCFVLARESGAWRIAAIRNMLPAPPATSPAGGAQVRP